MFARILNEITLACRIDLNDLLIKINEVKKMIHSKEKTPFSKFAQYYVSNYLDTIGVIDMIITSGILDCKMIFRKNLEFFNLFFDRKNEKIIEINIINEDFIGISLNGNEFLNYSYNVTTVFNTLNLFFRKKTFFPFLVVGKYSKKTYFEKLTAEFSKDGIIKKNKQLKVKIKNKNKNSVINTELVIDDKIESIENLFKKFDAVELGIDECYDLDGLTFAFDLENFSKFVKVGIELDLRKESKMKVLGKNDLIFFKKKMRKINKLLSVCVGSFNTDFGVVNLFLISASSKNNDKEAKEKLFFCLIEILQKEFLSRQEIFEIGQKNLIFSRIKKGENRSVVFLNNEYAGLFFLHLKDSKVLKKYKLFLYAESFGCKERTTSNNVLKIYDNITRTLNLTELYNLKVDICRSLRIKDLNKNKYVAGSFGKKSFENLPNKEIYEVFRSNRFCNMNQRNFSFKKGTINMEIFGLFKSNIYSSVITKILPPIVLRSRFPDSTCNSILSSFYGMEFKKEKANVRISTKIHTILKNTTELTMCDYPVRLEGNVLGSGMFDFSAMTSNFFERADMYYIDVIDLQNMVLSVFTSYLRSCRVFNNNICGFYTTLGMEVFLMEFCLKGGKLLSYVSKEQQFFFDNISFAEIVYDTEGVFERFFRKIEEEGKKESQITYLKNLIINKKGLAKKTKELICEIFNLVSFTMYETLDKIWNCFLDEIRESYKITNFELIGDDLVDTYSGIQLKEYIRGVFQFNGEKSIMKYMLLVNFFSRENLGTIEELYSSIERKIRMLNFQFLPGFNFFKTRKKSVKWIRILLGTVESEERLMLVDKLNQLVNVEEINSRMVRKPYWDDHGDLLRLKHGIEYYRQYSDKFCKIYNDFSYGFYFCRSPVNLKKSIYSMNSRLERLNSSEFNPSNFNIQQHFNYMEMFGIILNQTAKDLYSKIVMLDLDLKNMIYNRSDFIAKSEIESNARIPNLEITKNGGLSEQFEVEIEAKHDLYKKVKDYESEMGANEVQSMDTSSVVNLNDGIGLGGSEISSLSEQKLPEISQQNRIINGKEQQADQMISDIEKLWWELLVKKYGGRLTSWAVARTTLFNSKKRPSLDAWDAFIKKLYKLSKISNEKKGFVHE